MSNLKYKEKITDAYEIIKSVGRGIETGKIDIHSAMINLSESLRKLDSAKAFIDRE